MKKTFGILGLSFLLVMFCASGASAQGRLLRRLQEEAEKKAAEEILRGRETTEPPAEEQPARRQGASNTRGGGLEAETPDVNQSIADAETAFGSKDYKGAKAAIKDALWGVELEMGNKLLEALPKTVASLEADPSSDRVSSSGEELMGLTIERVYLGDDDMELRFTISNNSALVSMSGMAAAGMYQQRSDQDNMKQVQFQNHRGFIQYDDSSGYSLTVPFGQSSVLLLSGVNFETERSFMDAANLFSMELIKQKLGIQ